MKLAAIMCAVLISGCASSGSGGKEPCVKQDRCVIGCIVRENKCDYESQEKPDGTE